MAKKKGKEWKDEKRSKNADYLNPYKKNKKEFEEEFDDSFLDDENLRPKKRQK